MSRLLSTPRRRSVAGLALAAAFIPVMLGITACLETPIGDPEQGWVDPRITGVWLTGDPQPEDYSATLWSFEPYDQRTWLVTWVGFEDAEDLEADEVSENPADSVSPPADDSQAESAAPATPLQNDEVLRVLGTLGEDRAKPAPGTATFKAWITSIGDRRFLVLEPKVVADSETGFRPDVWFVFRIVLKADRMELAFPDLETDGLGEVTTRGEAEQIIARHAADPEFFEEPGMLYRLPRSAYDDVAAVFARAGIEQW